MSITVSIVIPYYNRKLKLLRTLKSIRNQTFTSYEIIIVDDFSDTPLSQNDIGEDVNYIRCKKNGGPGIARNIGLAKVTGSYVAFLDSDDYWSTTFLEKTVAKLRKNKNAIMCYSKGYYVDENEEIVREMRANAINSSNILPNIFLYGRPWGTGACLWRFDSIKDISWLESSCWEDYVFDVSAALVNNQIVLVDEFLVFYDLSGDNRLSKAKKINQVLDRKKSLSVIIDKLKGSTFLQNVKTTNKLSIFILNNSIELMAFKVKLKNENSFEFLNKYQGFYVYLGYKLATYLNNSLGLKILRFIRRQIKEV